MICGFPKAAIAACLCDFMHGSPSIDTQSLHTFWKAGRYRVALIVWNKAGRGARTESDIEVKP